MTRIPHSRRTSSGTNAKARATKTTKARGVKATPRTPSAADTQPRRAKATKYRTTKMAPRATGGADAKTRGAKAAKSRTAKAVPQAAGSERRATLLPEAPITIQEAAAWLGVPVAEIALAVARDTGAAVADVGPHWRVPTPTLMGLLARLDAAGSPSPGARADAAAEASAGPDANAAREPPPGKGADPVPDLDLLSLVTESFERAQRGAAEMAERLRADWPARAARAQAAVAELARTFEASAAATEHAAQGTLGRLRRVADGFLGRHPGAADLAARAGHGLRPDRARAALSAALRDAVASEPARDLGDRAAHDRWTERVYAMTRAWIPARLDPGHLDGQGYSPLDEAVVLGLEPAVMALLDAGVDPDTARARDGLSPLQRAGARGAVDLVHLMQAPR